MRLDLNLVEVFCCVYEEGSFSRAAKRLRLSQPTVSGHIKNLEAYIGARLFDRLPRRIVPTGAGQLLYRRGRSILNEREAAVQELKRFLNLMDGSLALVGSTIPGEYLLPPIIASFRISFPAVRVNLKISDSEAVCSDVLSGKAGVGFAGAKHNAAMLEFRHFASDELALIVPNNDEWRRVKTISLERLVQTPFLAREVGSGTRLAFERRIGQTLEGFNLVGCFGSTNSLKEGLRAGLGVSVLSLLAARADIVSGVLKAVEIGGIGKIYREFFAVINKSLTLSPISEMFLDYALGGAMKSTHIA